MASWDVFKPDVLVHVPTAPDPMIEMALRRASREFCGRTRAWRKWCACAETGAGTAIYTITIPTDAQAIRLERVTAGGKPVAVIPYHWHEADWETDPTQAGSGVSTDDLASFTSTTGSLTGSVRAMSKDTGGPAFPRPSYGPNEPADGMTLRDYLAAQAMNGMMANHWNKNYSDWAREAYKLADAMLAERSKS